jgi:predicted PurR-regulated permease PerM
MLGNRKGQIGESITWVVATIILIVILIVFIYASIVLAKTKSLTFSVNTNSEDSADWINSKTQIAYSINSNNKNKIDEWILQSNTNG